MEQKSSQPEVNGRAVWSFEDIGEGRDWGPKWMRIFTSVHSVINACHDMGLPPDEVLYSEEGAMLVFSDGDKRAEVAVAADGSLCSIGRFDEKGLEWTVSTFNDLRESVERIRAHLGR